MDAEADQELTSESFDAFFRREYRPVVGVAFALTGSRPAAEDLAMEAFEQALRHWGTLDNPSGWIRRVVTNRGVSRLRRLGAEARSLARLRPPDDGLVDVTSMAVWEGVRRLPPRQAQVVVLHHVDGLTRKEIAELLGIGEETVKTHLERGRARLAHHLEVDP